MSLGLERIGWRGRRYLFLPVVILAAMYLMDITNPLVNSIFLFKLEGAEILSVKNIVGVILAYLAVAIYYRQVE